MATTSYQDNFANNKVDWASPFQRTGRFPLDRSSMFSSFDDALAYAKQDNSDSRKIGGSAYIGQIISVYGNDAGTQSADGSIVYGTEVSAYIITGVGEDSASLMKLAQTTSSGDFSKDIQNLQTLISELTNKVNTEVSNLGNRITTENSALSGRISALEQKPHDVDTNTTYTFETAATTDGAFKYTSVNLDGTTNSGEVQIKGWETLVAIATGRSSAHVYQNKVDTQYLLDAKTADTYRVGDLIYFKDTNIADEWVTKKLSSPDSDGFLYEFSALETQHPDLTGYITTEEANSLYTKKTELESTSNALNTKINNVESGLAGQITNLSTNINSQISELSADLDTKAKQSDLESLQGDVGTLQDALGKIDVSSQITAKINELDVAKVGGTDNSYIKSIEQVDGKIVAVGSVLPDFDSNAQEKADKALSDAKDFVNSRVGQIDESITVKDYIDTTKGTLEGVISDTNSAMDSRVKVLESAKTSTEQSLQQIQSAVGQNETEISNVSGRVSTLESTSLSHSNRLSQLESKVDAIDVDALSNRIEVVKVGGVALDIDENDKSVNISKISTDLLTQGSKLLVLDCLNASLTPEE